MRVAHVPVRYSTLSDGDVKVTVCRTTVSVSGSGPSTRDRSSDVDTSLDSVAEFPVLGEEGRAAMRTVG